MAALAAVAPFSKEMKAPKRKSLPVPPAAVSVALPALAEL
jgi:hypothetical protein